jgi:hypothetical protein
MYDIYMMMHRIPKKLGQIESNLFMTLHFDFAKLKFIIHYHP